MQQQTTGLYVGNLDENVATDQLYAFFYNYDIINIHHPYDQILKKHKSFAFIYFQNPEQAKKARLEKNHEKIQFKSVRLMPIINLNQLNPDANVYVKNIDPAVTPQEFDVFFQQFGNVITSTLRCKDNGESLCYGYVQYETKECADSAIANNGFRLKDRNIQIELFKPKKKRQVFTQKTNLYFKNLPDGENLKDKVQKLFEKYGEITSMALKMDSNIQKRFGFVCFSTHESADAAYQALKDTDPFDIGQNLYINWAQSKYERLKEMRERFKNSRNETKLYIRSLKPEMTNELLKEVFSQFGEVKYSSIRDHKRGDQVMKFGFVEYTTKEDATKALAEASTHADVLAYSLVDPAYIKFAQSREIRRKYLRVQRQKKKVSAQNRGIYGGNRNMGAFNINNPQAQMLFLMMQQLSQGNAFGNMMKNFGMSNNYNRNRGQNYNRNRNRYNNQRNYQQNRNFRQRKNYQYQNQHQQHPQQMMTPQAVPQQQMMQTPHQMNPRFQMMGQQSQQSNQPTIQQLLQKWDYFMSMERQQQRNIMGEVIYPFVMKYNQQYAPKITGMLIDLDPEELKQCLMNEAHMVQKIQEAGKMLSAQDQQQQPPQQMMSSMLQQEAKTIQ